MHVPAEDSSQTPRSRYMMASASHAFFLALNSTVNCLLNRKEIPADPNLTYVWAISVWLDAIATTQGLLELGLFSPQPVFEERESEKSTN